MLQFLFDFLLVLKKIQFHVSPENPKEYQKYAKSLSLNIKSLNADPIKSLSLQQFLIEKTDCNSAIFYIYDL